VTLPCTLWFFDKGKKKSPRADTVLFLDARNIYRQIDRAHREWTPEQIFLLANIVRLYRGEKPDFTLGGEKVIEKLFLALSVKGSDVLDLSYRDIPGLCKAATIDEVREGYSLNPGRYVGVAAGQVVSDESLKAKLEALNEELEKLNGEALELQQTIAGNVADLLGS
jgi:type I restriction enzyme M protein